MKKISFCLVLLSLSTITFAGCAEKKKPDVPAAPATGAADATTPAADDATDPAPPSTDAPADSAE